MGEQTISREREFICEEPQLETTQRLTLRGLNIRLKMFPLSVCFLWLFVVVHANKTDWPENKWWHCSFPVFLSQLLNEQKRAGQKNSVKSFPSCSPGLKKNALGGCWRCYYTSFKKKISVDVVANKNKRSCSRINGHLLWCNILHLKSAVIDLSWPLHAQRHSPQ